MMKLFTVGPVEMYEETMKIGGEPLPYFRTKEFSEIMFQIEKDFLELVKAPKNAKLAILTASGTGAMEAAVCNTLTSKDRVLVISGGSFGKRFEELCQCYEIPFTALTVPFGQTLTKTMLDKYNNCGYTALLVNIHETSVGQLYDLNMLGDFCKTNKMCFIVDAISAFLSDEFDMEKSGVNMVITSSQKALALHPGLSFIVADDRVINERILKSFVKSIYFDLKKYFINMEKGQTPFTPAVGIILQLEERLNKIKQVGIDEIINSHKQLAISFREKCNEVGIQVAQYPKSNALTPILFPKGNAYEIFEMMKDEYGIILTPSGGELSGKLLRVGHLGNLNTDDYIKVIEILKEVI